MSYAKRRPRAMPSRVRPAVHIEKTGDVIAEDDLVGIKGLTR